MATPRVTAIASVGVAIALAILVPNVEGAGMPTLIGWIAVATLVVGLGAGEPTALVLASVAFVVRLAMLAPLDGPVQPPVWAQVFMIVVAVELASLSMESRVRPRFLPPALGRIALSGTTVMMVAIVLEAAVYGSVGGGLLLRVGAIVALVLLTGWVTILWSRALD